MAPLTKLRNRFAPAENRERGAVLVLTALVMLLLLFIAAFATDLGAWYRQGQEQQRAADVGALNGIQAYDRAVQDYWAGLTPPKSNWGELTDDEIAESERRGLEEAANGIIALLETSGLSFSDVGTGILAADPTDVNGTSVWTAIADDGTEVRITRSFVVTGTDSMDNPTYARSIDVQVIAPGEQYFSNIIRDAPEITREASATLANCAADCSDEFFLDPPFTGFDSAGKGDGYRPLWGEDGKVWTVNHHADSPLSYSVVCMDIRTEQQCSDWAPLDQKFVTGSKSADVIDNERNRIYFPANDFTKGGIGCVRTDARAYCPGNAEFTPLTVSDPHVYQPRVGNNQNDQGTMISFHGLWRVGTYPNDRLFAIGQDGLVHCFDPDQLGTATATCANYPKQSLLAANGIAESSSGDLHGVISDRVGDRIIAHMYVDQTNGYFVCWDTNTDSECWTPVKSRFGWDQPWLGHGFVRYNTTGGPIGFCYANGGQLSDNTTLTHDHQCVRASDGVITGNVPNLDLGFVNNSYFTPTQNFGNLYAGGYTWQGKRMFIGSLFSRTINCYNWETEQMCGTFTTPKGDSYGMMAIPGTDCMLTVGDRSAPVGGANGPSQYYAFDALDLDPCTVSSVSAEINPCPCTDGSGEERYGTLTLPDSLRAVLVTAEATVVGGGMTETGNLMDGPMDLSVFNGTPGPLNLEIEVDAILGNDGNPLWKDRQSVSLDLIVQPTLAN